MGGQVVKRVTLAAGATSDVMTGTPHEYPDARGNKLTVAGVTNTVGGTVTVQAGTRIIAEDVALTVAGANVMPVIPDNVVAVGIPARISREVEK